MPEIKNTDREIKPAFDVLIMRPNIMRLKEENGQRPHSRKQI